MTDPRLWLVLCAAQRFPFLSLDLVSGLSDRNLSALMAGSPFDAFDAFDDEPVPRYSTDGSRCFPCVFLILIVVALAVSFGWRP